MKPNPIPPEYKRYKTLEEANAAEEEEMKRLQKILDSGFFSEPTHITDIAMLSGGFHHFRNGKITVSKEIAEVLESDPICRLDLPPAPSKIMLFKWWALVRINRLGRMVEWVRSKLKAIMGYLTLTHCP